MLLKVFPQGLESRDPAQAKALRAAYDEWQENPTAPGRQRAWVLHVLSSLLGYPANLISEGQTLPAGLEANMAEMGETLRPNFALVAPSGTETAGQAQLLIASYPAEQALDHPVIGKHWKANSATRMTELLHATGVPLGLVTNGEQWMLVFAPRGETAGYASWYSALWLDEPTTLRAFHSLLGVRRFFGVAADSTLLGLLKESAQDQQEVTDQLGYQVRQAVQVLVQAFDSLDQDSNRTLLKGVSEPVLYEAALTVMMRLVFLFSAEERGLLHLGKPLYDDNYAVSTLLGQLQEVADLHGPQVLERRFDAWTRLLATFRALHAGVHHQDLLMPAYGGSLFDPDRFPFLEGRGIGTKWTATQAQPLAVNNRVALHLLTSLQRLRIKVPGGGPSEARRVSFRALGVEQIGHVYEGLLDHTAVRANETVLGIKGTRDKETEIPLTTLEAKLTQGQDTLTDFLKDETGRSASAIRKAMEEDSSDDEHKLLIACGHEKELLQRVRPFVGLIRKDSFERPVVVLPGSVYVTVGTTRRSTGTHYTPPSLTEPIVQYTLEPVVYQGPAEGLPREQWQLKSPKEILDLKVCDMAMGSGAFLVQACRYLAERLTEAWENEEKKHPNEVLVTPEGGFSQGSPSERLVPQDSAELVAIARRIIADRCLYGVDINPMAVEMAKLSLWLVTLDAKRPFTFLDHAFKCGDSLLGLSTFQQLENFTLRPEGGKQIAFSTMNLWRHIDEAKTKRELLESMPSDTPDQIAVKVVLHAEAEEAVAKLKAAADVLVGVELGGLKGNSYELARETAADQLMFYWAQGLAVLRGFADARTNGRKTFHWPVEFPEVFGKNGFSAIIGNPPFLGGVRVSEIFGVDYNNFLALVNPPASKKADLASYFFRRAASILTDNGCFGLLATKTVAQGKSREAGLDHILSNGAAIFRAETAFKWPGGAAVLVCVIHVTKLDWTAQRWLDGRPYAFIDGGLVGAADKETAPEELPSSAGLAYQGSSLLGMGFVLCPEEAKGIIASDPISQEVITPYLGGEDINRLPDLIPTRSAINFGEMSETEARLFVGAWGHVEKSVKPERMQKDVAAYPRLVNEWWKYWHSRQALYHRIRPMERILVCARVSKRLMFRFAPGSWTFNDKVIAIARQSFSEFAILQSTFHEAWAWKYGSTLKADLNYVAKNCHGTFPFPSSLQGLDDIARQYESHRHQLMLRYQEGLTAIYNRFHNPIETGGDIAEFRRLHAEVDQAVVAAYGWNNFLLDHTFHKTKQGLRYTLSETAQRDALERLLALNHLRHAEEESERMNFGAQPKPIKHVRKPKAEGSQIMTGLFDFGGAENE